MKNQLHFSVKTFGSTTDIVWLLLMPLTLISYYSSENNMTNIWSTHLLLGIATLKVLLIGIEFMELKRTHRFFRYGFGLFFVGLALGLLLLFQS